LIEHIWNKFGGHARRTGVWDIIHVIVLYFCIIYLYIWMVCLNAHYQLLWFLQGAIVEVISGFCRVRSKVSAGNLITVNEPDSTMVGFWRVLDHVNEQTIFLSVQDEATMSIQCVLVYGFNWRLSAALLSLLFFYFELLYVSVTWTALRLYYVLVTWTTIGCTTILVIYVSVTWTAIYEYGFLSKLFILSLFLYRFCCSD
jgi:hypothetical protein